MATEYRIGTEFIHKKTLAKMRRRLEKLDLAFFGRGRVREDENAALEGHVEADAGNAEELPD